MLHKQNRVDRRMNSPVTVNGPVCLWVGGRRHDDGDGERNQPNGEEMKLLLKRGPSSSAKAELNVATS
jgi:hypothetical protein